MSDVAKPTPRRRIMPRGRAVVLWSVLFIAVVKLGMLGLEFSQPYRRDPEFARKFSLLRAKLAEHPDRPLVLAIGSSRIDNGLRPDMIPELRTAEGEIATVFNFGMVGSGPIHQQLFLRRILREGIVPRHLIMEVHPILLHQNDTYNEEQWLNVQRLTWHDLPHINQYLTRSASSKGKWLSDIIWQRTLADPLIQRRTHAIWKTVDQHGWLPWGRGTIVEQAADFEQQLEQHRTEHFFALDNFEVTETPDRVLRDTLTLCRDAGIQVTILRMPEHSTFRGWYSADTQAKVDDYLGRLSADFQISQIDASNWCGNDGFIDGHHLMANGATEFTRMLGQSVMQPLVAGLPIQSSPLVAERPNTTR